MKAAFAWITTHKLIAILAAVAVILITVGTIVAINSAGNKPPIDDASDSVVTTATISDAVASTTLKNNTSSATQTSGTTANTTSSALQESATETTKDGASTTLKTSTTKAEQTTKKTTVESTPNVTTKTTAVQMTTKTTQTPTTAATRHYCSQYMQWTVNKLPENGEDGYLEQRCSICGWTWSKVLPGFSDGKTATHAQVQEYAMWYLQSKGCITEVIDDPWIGGFNPPFFWYYGQPFDEEMKESIRNHIDYEYAYHGTKYLTAYASEPEYDQSGYTDPYAGWLYIVKY